METNSLALKANNIRKNIVTMLNLAGSGHPGGALGMADIFATLYFEVMKTNPKKPNDSNRDFLILSNGHICAVLYATLAEKGYFEQSELKTLRKLGSRLQGHPHNGSLPGVENTSGPLGQGISQAVGLAASLKRDKKKNRVFCIVGDGEINEGECWEAILFAQNENLDNLTIVVDRNNIQIDGSSDDVMNLNPLDQKLASFGCRVITINGNDFSQIRQSLKHASKLKGKPVAIIANTTPGKGVSFMENKHQWHGKAPNDDELKQALEDLNK